MKFTDAQIEEAAKRAVKARTASNQMGMGLWSEVARAILEYASEQMPAPEAAPTPIEPPIEFKSAEVNALGSVEGKGGSGGEYCGIR